MPAQNNGARPVRQAEPASGCRRRQAQASPLPRERLAHLARRIYRLGERPLFELLAELERGEPFRERLEAYAALP